MELEIKHISPYLPYDLYLQFVINGYVVAEDLMTGIQHYNWETHSTKVRVGIIEAEHIWMFKPILKPLSEFGESDDLRKVHEFIGFGKWCDAYDEYFKEWFNDSSRIDKLIMQAPYEIFQYFLSEHYDVFGLIKQGLAVKK